MKTIFFMALLVAQLIPISSMAKAKTTSQEQNGSQTVATLYDFWASWCGPCEESFPHLEKLHKKYGHRIEFIGVNKDANSNNMNSFLKKHPVTFQQVRDEDDVLQEKFSIKALPTTVLMDSKGKEIFRLRGYRKGEDTKIEEALKRALDQSTQLHPLPSPR